jgi:hypothetical protein
MNPLANARAELDSLRKLKAEIEMKMEAVTQSIAILEPSYAQEHEPSHLLNLSVMMTGLENMGITDAVRWALTTSLEGLSPTQVRDVLVEHGYSVCGENPMATIHTVLKRLAHETGGSVVVEGRLGRTVYKYLAQPADHGKSQSSTAESGPFTERHRKGSDMTTPRKRKVSP